MIKSTAIFVDSGVRLVGSVVGGAALLVPAGIWAAFIHGLSIFDVFWGMNDMMNKSPNLQRASGWTILSLLYLNQQIEMSANLQYVGIQVSELAEKLLKAITGIVQLQ